MAYNRNLYSSDTDALDAGIIYDQNELMMQDEINAAIKNGDLIVGQADNLASKMNQFSTGEFIERTTGGDASLSDGDGHLVLIRGNMIHEGYIAKSVNMTVTPIERDPSAGEFTAQIDNDLFLAEMQDTSGTMVFTYGSSGWDNDPSDYGITTDGLTLPGDVISVTYQKEVRGTITQSDPQTFVSTGWNLYDHSKGYARALYYNNNPRFGITGTYTSVQYSLTITGAKSSVTPDANGTFGIPTDGNGGYIWVNGGNDTDTAVWMCWSDWTTQANGGVWEAYSESEIDLSTIMATYFVNGLMAVGSYQDEIDLSLGKVTANVGKMTYSDENLDDVIAMGVDYDYDDSYIYYGLTEPIVSQISIDNTYAAYDHGIEYYTVTQVPIYTQTLYGVNLKNRLERDVVTISQQTLTASEQAQVATNLGVVKKSGDEMTNSLIVYNGNFDTKRNADIVTTPNQQVNWTTGHRDINNYYVSYWQTYTNNNGSVVSGLSARKNINGTPIDNGVSFIIDSSGNKTVSVSDADAWRSAIGAVNKAGDTMTGSLYINGTLAVKNYDINGDRTDTDITTIPSANKNWALRFRDQNGVSVGAFTTGYTTGGNTSISIFARKVINGVNTDNTLIMSMNADGTREIGVSSPQAWRKAIGIGQSTGALPITIAQGGTGQTDITSTSTLSQIATAATGFTFSSPFFIQWGKVAILRIAVTKNASWTNGQTVGTVVNGKRPYTQSGFMCYTHPYVAGYLNPDGTIYITSTSTIAANATVYMYATYILT